MKITDLSRRAVLLRALAAAASAFAIADPECLRANCSAQNRVRDFSADMGIFDAI